MVGREGIKAYLTYPNTMATRSFLLKERKRRLYLVYKDGKCINAVKEGMDGKKTLGLTDFNCYEPMEVPVYVMRETRNNPFIKYKPVEGERYEGKPHLFGVSAESSVVRGTNLIRVRVTADTVEMLFSKIAIVKSEMVARGIKEQPKMCAWSRIGRLASD